MEDRIKALRKGLLDLSVDVDLETAKLLWAAEELVKRAEDNLVTNGRIKK